MGGHSLPNEGKTNVWLTPPDIVEALGQFDLDPCASVGQPWQTASTQYTVEDDGLAQDWKGRVWCNPPYGPHSGQWLDRMAEHRNGIALIFARTETEMFFEKVWNKADALLFLQGRLFFHYPDGVRAEHNAGAPSVLLAYGQPNVRDLMRSGIAGALVTDWKVQ